MSHEETLAVVVYIDEPTCNVVRGGAANLASGWIVDIHALDFGDYLPVLLLPYLHIRLAEDHEEVTRAGLLEQFIAHRKVGVHLRREYCELAVAFRLLGNVRVECKTAGDKHVEAHAPHRFLGGFLHLLRADSPVLRSD